MQMKAAGNELIIILTSVYYFKGALLRLRHSRVAQWLEHLPPTNVARFKSWY